MKRSLAHLAAALLAAALVLGLAATPAHAQLQPDLRVYIVAQGDTLSTIAARLGVTTRALAERNHLEPPYPLRVGQRLRLPSSVAASALLPSPARREGGASTVGTRGAGRRRGERDWGRPRRPGLVRLVREHNDETLTINLRRVSNAVARRMARFLRFSDGRQHPINVRLLRLLAVVSDHFGGRVVHVISGFRPFRRGQWTPHSNHNIGHAIDFRVEGVPNRVVRDFCRTLPNTGCGYYPRSVFVHMDVRAESTSWVDWSRPGQRPMYGREDRPPSEVRRASAHPTGESAAAPAGADEGVDDVAADSNRVRTAPPAPDEDEREGDEGGGEAPAAGSSAPAGPGARFVPRAPMGGAMLR